MTPAKKRRFGRVRKLPSGRWQVRYRGPDGADHPAPTTFVAKRDAERFLTLVEADVAQGRWIAPQAGRTTVAEWTEEWFAAAMPSLKAKTRHTYRSLLTRMVLPRFGNVTIAAVLPMTVGRWVADLTGRVGPSQVRQAYRLLSQIMDSAVDNGLIAVSPCRGVKLPRLPEPDPTILTAEHVDRLVAELSPPDDLLVLVLAYGGLRIGEALCLRRRHIDLADGRVMVAEAVTHLPGGPVIDTPKSHQRRQLALPAFVVDRLRLHLDDLPERDDAFLFPGRQQRTADRPQSYNGWKYRFDRAVERAGLTDLIPHDLRATHGSWVADSHGVLVAARRLGHSNASVTTRHYARAVDGRDAEVAVFLDRARGTGTALEGARNGHDQPAAAVDVQEKGP